MKLNELGPVTVDLNLKQPDQSVVRASKWRFGTTIEHLVLKYFEHEDTIVEKNHEIRKWRREYDECRAKLTRVAMLLDEITKEISGE